MSVSAAIKSPNKYGDLSNRLWFLLGALIVYRIGAHIPVPGIDPARLRSESTRLNSSHT